ncbi:uncharacterized protein BCR38DRAFT_418509 [Pseudomassariella vexata]|uniref:Rhodopsin domain-containing protein n=1 Tax=Pseudomassariella vexata TaxID=1141098 RepID=A0A1Y2EKA0_9PEZI|nr:uncharacterized protein BCR38DRAFT_418509 [Pseudomassariella vexata]ORY71957.1 hypothetical protein BCR38DRAFT_418509 [Pseudomassariella vexata]
MAFSVYNDSEQGAAFTLIIVTLPICILSTILRFTSTRHSERKVGLEDWFALLALLFYLGYVGLLTSILVLMNGRNVFELGELPLSTVTAIFKLGYVMNEMDPGNQTFAKLSLLALYYRFFSSSRKFAYWVYFVGTAQVMWYISIFWVRWFACLPVSSTWDLTEAGTCINQNAFFASTESINSAIDFVMVGMAIWMVKSLRLSIKTKWQLSFVFMLGGFSGVVGIIKIAEAYGSIGSNIENAIWNVVQLACSIICCCAPIYKSMFSNMSLLRGFGSSFRSGMNSWKSRKSSSEGSSPL